MVLFSVPYCEDMFWVFSCLFFLFSPTLYAVEFQAVGVDRGLDAKIVSFLLIDRHGFLWAASREGLYRYDGYNAERFMPDGRPGSITDADLRMLYEAKDGRIWVATNNGGLNVYDILEYIIIHNIHPLRPNLIDMKYDPILLFFLAFRSIHLSFVYNLLNLYPTYMDVFFERIPMIKALIHSLHLIS